MSTNTKTNTFSFSKVASFLAIAALAFPLALKAEEPGADGAADESSAPGKREERRIVIERLDRGGPSRDLPWLGVSTEESTEALSSQLGLPSGAGLVVTFVASNSPAATAGLLKNDLLVSFDDQELVHPAQLRKLVQMRKTGETVKLTYYRAGKKDEATVKLGKAADGFGALDFGGPGDHPWAELRELQRHLGELPAGAKLEMQRLRENLARAGINRESLQREIQHSMEEARRAMRDALRQATNAHRTFGPAVRQMEEIVKRGVDVDKDATITVRSHHDSVKTIVKTDETGTYVLLAAPKKHLTIHDKAGKLLFDGEIETSEQQAKVPRDLWQKVEPMVDDLAKDPASPAADEDKPEAEQGGI